MKFQDTGVGVVVTGDRSRRGTARVYFSPQSRYERNAKTLSANSRKDKKRAACRYVKTVLPLQGPPRPPRVPFWVVAFKALRGAW